MSTDRDWERWGRDDPYYGVLSSPEYRRSALSDEARAKFFRSGEEHVDTLLARIRRFFAPDFRPGSSLDFGCGVGRLLLPLARVSTTAVGVDVSESMRAEAARNVAAAGLGNVTIVDSDDALSAAPGPYDLVHSVIVFAHIPAERGEKILLALADRVAPGGMLSVQIVQRCNAPTITRALVRASYRFPPLNMLRNLVRGRPLGEPPMQLNVYDLPALLSGLKARGFPDVLVTPDALDEGIFETATLLGQRTAAAG